MDKPRVLISKCIEHGSCRYDGNTISDEFVRALKPYVEFLPVCPEVEIGLGVPREAIRIIYKNGEHRLTSSKSGRDVTDEMMTFTENYISNLDLEVDGAILKSKSPSCGFNQVKVYMDIGKSPALSRKTSGFFGGPLYDHFDLIPVEDEKRLNNAKIRQHFLIRLFTLNRFKSCKKVKTMNELINFHSCNKYLLMAYHQLNQKKLGKLVANHDHYPIEEVYYRYEHLLKRTLLTPIKNGKNINMLMHLFGYFKHVLTSEEKAYFIDLLDDYKNKVIGLDVPLSLIKSWVIRFDERYLKDQSIFSPYPNQLNILTKNL